jgi:phosphatidylglycerol:prolipoprotein diacylglycerol transferase
VTAWLFVRRCNRSGLETRHAAIAAILAVAGGMLGARIYYLLHHYRYVLENPRVIVGFGAGIASFGAYIGGTLALVVYLRAVKQDLLRYLDVLGSVLGLGPFVVRWACFLNGCCYGTPSDLSWAVRYPAHTFAWRAHARNGLIGPGDELSLPVHPVQIYLSLLGLACFVIASRFWKRYAAYRGATFVLFWLVYGAGRFFLEFLRGDVPRYTAVGLTLSQIVIVAVLCAVVAGFLWPRGRAPKTSV